MISVTSDPRAPRIPANSTAMYPLPDTTTFLQGQRTRKEKPKGERERERERERETDGWTDGRTDRQTEMNR